MKKIFGAMGMAIALLVSGASFASAQYYTYPYDGSGNYTYNYNYGNGYTPYYNTYTGGSYSNSYQYVQGCYIYNYDRYTGITSLVGSRCNTNTYNNNYHYNYTYPYNTGCNYSSYGYAYYNSNCYNGGYGYSNYGTYQYINGAWYPGGYNYNYGYTYPNYNYNNGGCYYVGNQMACY